MWNNQRNLLLRLSIGFNIFILVYFTIYYFDESCYITINTQSLSAVTDAVAEESKYEDFIDETFSHAIKNSLKNKVPTTLLETNALDQLRLLLECNNKDFLSSTEQRGDYWVLKNYVRADHGPVSCYETVTYTTQSGFVFLDNVIPLVDRWMAPVSLAIYAPGEDFIPAVNSIRYLRDCFDNDHVRKYVTFHLFFPNKHLPENVPDPETFNTSQFNCSIEPPYYVNESTQYIQRKSLIYPINVARNIARDAALTHFVLASDIELYPSPDLVPKFLSMLVNNPKALNDFRSSSVFAIPVFEVSEEMHAPSTKTELQAMLRNKTAVPFHKYMCPTCHTIPKSKEWMSTSETTHMEVFHTDRRIGRYKDWEPFFIGTHQDPHYDDRLSWNGKKNKIVLSYILCLKDYKFKILNNAFLTHKPGIKHYKTNRERDTHVVKQNAFIANVIKPQLHILYGIREGCKL